MEMADPEETESFEGLLRDLAVLSEGRIPPLDRLAEEISSKVGDFKGLLDKPGPNEASRKQLLSGKIVVDDVELEVNEEFKAEVMQVSSELELDELESAKLFLIGQRDALELDRSPVLASILRFHKRRQFLLECLRMIFERPLNEEIEVSLDDTMVNQDALELQTLSEFKQLLDSLKTQILSGPDGKIGPVPEFWRRCFSSLHDIENWLVRLSEQVQRMTLVGQVLMGETKESHDFQRTSLITQHEALSAICCYLIRDGFVPASEYTTIFGRLRLSDKYDSILVHLVPILMGFIEYVGKKVVSSHPDEAEAIHKSLVGARTGNVWSLRSFHAATLLVWLSEYAGRDFGDEAKTMQDRLTELVLETLKDGAFHFILSIVKDVRDHSWCDSAKDGLTAFLLQDAPALSGDTESLSPYMQNLMMEYMQTFVETLITNMPDMLRLLKAREDENHQLLQSTYMLGQGDYDMHLERFLIIISYVYEGSPEATLDFWVSPDGNLNGFLHWAGKRQTTPRAAAYCEMLQSLSEGEVCANHAHRFLLEQGSNVNGKNRRPKSLSWSQILSELEFYTSYIKDRSGYGCSATSFPASAGAINDHTIEPESQLMLECYLRLIAHMCVNSPEAREWIPTQLPFSLLETLLFAYSRGIEGRLRACVLNVMSSLLKDKTREIGHSMWLSFDQWIFTGLAIRTPGIVNREAWIRPNTRLFELFSGNFEEANSFMRLLNGLFAKITCDALPFPETLGAHYRKVEIDTYVDFAMGCIFGDLSRNIDASMQQWILRLNCLEFIYTCLDSFNDNLVILSMLMNVKVDAALEISSLGAYLRLHPFARVMDWLFNDEVLVVLFASAHEDIEIINKTPPGSPIILAITRCIQVMDAVMRLQSTYLDYVRPYVKAQAQDGRICVANMALTSFEDSVLNNLQLIVDLGLYCGSSHLELVLAALKLLGKMSYSKKLAKVVKPPACSGNNSGSGESKILSIMERENESECVSRALLAAMQIDLREWEIGPDSPAYQVKREIVEFLFKTLEAVPDQATVAHILMGFSCHDGIVDITRGGLFDAGLSLFHTIVKLGIEYPRRLGEGYCSWLGKIKERIVSIMRILWTSRISSKVVMMELHETGLIFHWAISNEVIDNNTLWNGQRVDHDDFIFGDAALGLAGFLRERAAFYDCFTRELYMTKVIGMPSYLSKLESTLNGVTSLEDGQQIRNASIFDLIDFLDIKIDRDIVMVSTKYFGDIDLSLCESVDGMGSSEATYLDIDSVKELLLLRMKELKRGGSIELTEADIEQMNEEFIRVLTFSQGINNLNHIKTARYDALECWINLLLVYLDVCELDDQAKALFTEHTLKVMIRKLAKSLNENDFRIAEVLMKAAKNLLYHISGDIYAQQVIQDTDVSNDIPFQLFRLAIDAIVSVSSTEEVRHSSQQVIASFIGKIRKAGQGQTWLNCLAKRLMVTIRAKIERLCEVVCDDAQRGNINTRVPALLLLEGIVWISYLENCGSGYSGLGDKGFISSSMTVSGSSTHNTDVIENFGRINFIGLLVDNVKRIKDDLLTANSEDIGQLILCFKAILALLSSVCRTKAGSTLVLNAGWWNAIHNLHREEILVAVVRVIINIVLTRGIHNERIIQQVWNFLSENETRIRALFQTFRENQKSRADLEEQVMSFTFLICVTDFLHDDHNDFDDVQSTEPRDNFLRRKLPKRASISNSTLSRGTADRGFT